jgi:hypothetical protein
MSVCVYSVFVLSCVQVAALRRTDPPSKESYRLRKTIKKLKKRPSPIKGSRATAGWSDGRTDRQTAIQIDR